MQYIALLRGINVGGKNKIAMQELKACIQGAGFSDVRTYLNSGNIIFSYNEESAEAITESIHSRIKEHFGLDIPVFITPTENIRSILRSSPDWWGTGNSEIYDNLIFLLPPADAQAIAARIGAPTEGIDQILISNNAIFWSFDRKRYNKSNWWKKTASAGIGEFLTIRTANTIRKLIEISEQ